MMWISEKVKPNTFEIYDLETYVLDQNDCSGWRNY